MPSEVGATWVGLSQLSAALEKVAGEYDAATRRALTAAAAVVERAAKANFQGSHKRGEPHVGGDKPNVVTGTLRRSITFDPPHRVGLASYATTVGPHVIYARRVELGYAGGQGRGRQKTRPFPYFEPAVSATRETVLEAYSSIMRAVRG